MGPHGTRVEKLKVSVQPLALGRTAWTSLQCLGSWCSEMPASHYHGEGVAWPACDCVMCGGLAGSGKNSWLKITIFVLLCFVALVILNPNQLFGLLHITL